MRINEILVESKKLDEKSPVGLGAKLKAGIKSAFGSASGKAQKDVNTRATEIYTKFQDWALRSGLDMNAMPAKEIKGWFKQQNLIYPKDFAAVNVLNLGDKNTSTKFWQGAASAAFKSGAQAGAGLGSGYGLGGASAAAARPARKISAAARSTAKAPTDFKSLQSAISQLKPSLAPNEINALVKALTG